MVESTDQPSRAELKPATIEATGSRQRNNVA